MKSIIFATVAVSLGACAVTPQTPEPYTYIRSERPGPDYHAFLARPSEGHAAGGAAVTRQVKLFAKPLNENGTLALCGFYTVEMTDTEGRASPEGPDRLIREQLNSPNATLALDGQIVGDLSFLRPHGPGDGEVRANCVATRLPWKDAYAKARPTYHWPALSLHNG